MDTQKAIKAIDIISEDQLAFLLDRSGIVSSSPKEVDWLYHWWVKEFDSEPPIARRVIITGNEGYAPGLCFAVEQNKFAVYRLDESNFWFHKLGEIEEFSTHGQINEYLEGLVNQDLKDWNEWMKQHAHNRQKDE